MNWFIDTALLFFALGGGYWAWRRETRALYKRGLEERPSGMSHREHERLILGKRKRWRLIKSALGALGGAVVGFLLMMAFALRR